MVAIEACADYIIPCGTPMMVMPRRRWISGETSKDKLLYYYSGTDFKIQESYLEERDKN